MGRPEAPAAQPQWGAADTRQASIATPPAVAEIHTRDTANRYRLLRGLGLEPLARLEVCEMLGLGDLGQRRSSAPIACTSTCATSACATSLWSAGITYQGAQLVDVAVRASSKAAI